MGRLHPWPQPSRFIWRRGKARPSRTHGRPAHVQGDGGRDRRRADRHRGDGGAGRKAPAARPSRPGRDHLRPERALPRQTGRARRRRAAGAFVFIPRGTPHTWQNAVPRSHASWPRSLPPTPDSSGSSSATRSSRRTSAASTRSRASRAKPRPWKYWLAATRCHGRVVNGPHLPLSLGTRIPYDPSPYRACFLRGHVTACAAGQPTDPNAYLFPSRRGRRTSRRPIQRTGPPALRIGVH